MRRLFVPSVVLLVLSVVMMVGSWFKLWFELPGRVLGVSLSYGQVLIHLPGDPNGFATSGGYVNVNVAWPLVPQYNSNFFGGWYIIVPCWYFVVLCAALVVMFWHPWLQARRISRLNLCDTCGYDLRGVYTLCPECGKSINTQGANP